jgi:hypothetical protein
VATVAPGKTQAPAPVPTNAPTPSEVQVLQNLLQNVLTALAQNQSAGVAHASTFSELSKATVGTRRALTGVAPTADAERCSSWRSLLSGDVTISAQQFNPVGVRLAVAEPAGLLRTTRCNSSDVARMVVESLLNPSDPAVSVSCAGNTWVVKRCSGGAPAVCVDCVDPCLQSAYCSTQGALLFALSPCVTTACPSGTTAPSAARALSISYAEQKPAPSLLQPLMIVPTPTSLTITAILSAPGYVYCAAYVYGGESRPEPTSASSVVLQNNVATTDSGNVGTVVITGLPGASYFMVYCATVSTTGAIMPLADVIANSQDPSTTCCIPVRVETLSSSVVEDDGVRDFLVVTVNTRPKEDVTITIDVYDRGVRLNNESLFPATFTLSSLVGSKAATGVSGSTSSQGNALNIQTIRTVSSLKPLRVGTYKYKVTLSGPSAHQFNVTYANSQQTIAVFAKAAPLPAPLLLSVAYADDGSKVVLSFDSSTDRGGAPSQFSCSALFAFACANTSKCIWTDNKRVDAYVGAAESCAPVGSPVRLATTAVLKAQCQKEGANCDRRLWPASSTSVTVTVAAALSAIAPSVVLSAPDTVGQCDSLVLDISASSGSGGRPWKSRTIAVETDAPNATNLQSFLKDKYQDSPPRPATSSLFVSGYSYNFVAKLCNFLGKCGQANKRVLVQNKDIPTATLPGSPMRLAQRWSPLSIASSAYVLQCDKNTRTTAGLNYAWAVSLNGAPVQVKPASKDPSVFVIPAFSLQVERVYDVTVTVTVAANNQATKATTQVYVVRGNIIAAVRDGTTRTVQEGGDLVIDGSPSYDQDNPTGSELSFTWACALVKPVFNSDCADSFSQFKPTASSNGYIIVAKPHTADIVAEITMYILDGSISRSAQAVVTVTVVQALAPVVSLRTNIPVSGIFNSDRELQLTGSVRIAAGQSGKLAWSASEYAQFSLRDAALSPLDPTVPISSVVQSYDVSLAVRSYSLPDRAVLAFTLSASAASITSTASATVTVNAAPLPGTFAVGPRSGTEINTTFTFVASQWYDADLPLQYQFGYMASSGTAVTLRSKAEVAFWSGVLTAGSSFDGNLVNCTLQVIDSLEASRSVFDTVRVAKQEYRTSTTVAATILDVLTAAEGSVDGIKQATALSTYLLNEVDCSNAPNCTSLNRQACCRIPHTCGPCLSHQYVGDEGDSNQPCHLLTNLTQFSVGSSCGNAADCGPFQGCKGGLCAPLAKMCLGNCSFPQGSCVTMHADTGEPVPSCYVGDPSCRAICNCTAGYVGSSTCNVSTTTLLQRQALRSQVIQKVATLIATENANLQSYQGWVSSLTLATQSTDEVSGESASVVLSAAAAVLTSGVTVTPDEARSVLTPVDSALAALENAVLRLRLNGTSPSGGGTVDRYAVLLNASSVLRDYAQYVTGFVLPGQYAVEAVLPQIRVLVQKPSVLDLAKNNGSLVVSVPQSALEQTTHGHQIPSIALPLNDTSEVTSINITLATVRSQLLNSELGLSGADQIFSNAVSVGVSGLPCGNENCSFDIVLPTAASMVTLGEARGGLAIFNTTCRAGVASVIHHVCSDGTILRVQCNGTASYVVHSRCPLTTYEPTCSALVNLLQGNRTCEVKGRTGTNITCSCPLPKKYHIVADALDGSLAEVSYVAMLTEIKNNFVETIKGAGHLSIERGVVTFITIGSLAGAVLLALFWSHNADAEAAAAAKSVENKSADALKKRSFGHLTHLSDTLSDAFQKYAGAVNTSSRNLAPEEEMVEQALPSILSSDTFFRRVINELKRHHRWLGIVYFYSPGFPRTVRVLSLISNLMVILCMQAATYNLMSPDEKHCKGLSPSRCDDEVSPYQTAQHMCYWDSHSNQCELMRPDAPLFVVVFVAMFTALVATPVAVLTDHILMTVLAAPTRKPSTITPSPSSQPQLIPSEDLGSSSNSIRVVQDKPSSSTGNLLHQLVTKGSATLTASASLDSSIKSPTLLRRPLPAVESFLVGLFVDDNSDSIATQMAMVLAKKDLVKLTADISAYQATLSAYERAEFDGEDCRHY